MATIDLATYEEEFDAFIKNNGLGCRLDIDELFDENLRAQLYNMRYIFQANIDANLKQTEQSDQNYKNLKFEYVHFDFIDCSTFNAIAFKNKNQYFIGINIGTYQLLLNSFNRIMSRPDTHNRIGNVSIEKAKIVFPLANNFLDVINYYELHDLDLDGTPTDPARISYATSLTFISLYFLLIHELTHIVHGHIDYKASIGVGSSFMEYNEKQDANNVFTKIDSQVL